MRGIAIAAVLGLGLLLGGCGTIVNVAVGVDYHEGGGTGSAFGTSVGGLHWRTQIYGGIQADITGIDKCLHGEHGTVLSILLFPLFVLVEFPLSLVGDTITLPYTVPVDLLYEPRKPSSP